MRMKRVMKRPRHLMPSPKEPSIEADSQTNESEESSTATESPKPEVKTRRGKNVLTLEELIALRDKLQALEDADNLPLRYYVGMVTTPVRGLVFQMEKNNLTEIRA